MARRPFSTCDMEKASQGGSPALQIQIQIYIQIQMQIQIQIQIETTVFNLWHGIGQPGWLPSEQSGLGPTPHLMIDDHYKYQNDNNRDTNWRGTSPPSEKQNVSLNFSSLIRTRTLTLLSILNVMWARPNIRRSYLQHASRCLLQSNPKSISKEKFQI